MNDNKTYIRRIEYNENYDVVLSNEIIRGKQSSNILEARFIRLVIAQIEQKDTELWKYTTTVKEFADFFGIDKSNLYRNLQNICREIRSKDVLISSDDPKQPWEAIGWFDKVEYANGIITFTLSQSIKPYVIGLQKFFTKCKLKYFACLSTVYGIRLYEIIQAERGESRKNTVVFSYQYLREILLSARKKGDKPDNRYPLYGNFKKKIIDKAIEDINNNTDLFIKNVYGETYGQKSTVDVVFEVESKALPNKTKNTIPTEEVPFDVEKLYFIANISDNDKKTLLKVANNDISLIREKYELACKQKEIRNMTAWLIKAIQENYTVVEKEYKKFNDFHQREYTKADFRDMEMKLLSINNTKKSFN